MKFPDKITFLNAFCIFSTLFSFALFLQCYFPMKRGLEGHATVAEAPREPVSGRQTLPASHYRRLVLLVIDAMRADFVLGNAPFMPFTKRRLSERHGIAFVAKTHPPTVTLPRIKAITTGSIPGFVDVVMNFGSTVLMEDNLIMQLKLAKKTLTFFGDDTWLNLFPDHFTRSDGTTSFFVTDYTEVDNNVTRHLSRELSSSDWDVMTLHYLGLDHIGHLAGPTSPLLPPKLLEMDAVVQQIYSSMESWSATKTPSLLVICGDHGMSDQGGHGGASHGEVTVPVIMLSPHTQFKHHTSVYPEMRQIDLCPSLSVLLGLPIPKNNLGAVQIAALPLNTTLREKVRLMQLNAVQLVKLLEKNVGDIDQDKSYQLYQSALVRHTEWLTAVGNLSSLSSTESLGSQVLLAYQDAVHRMSERISEMSTRYDMYGICLSVTALWLNLITLILLKLKREQFLPQSTQYTRLITSVMLIAAMLGHMTACTSQYSSEILCGTSVVSLTLQSGMLVSFVISVHLCLNLCLSALTSRTKHDGKRLNCVELLLVCGTVLHTLSLVSSSFVEEEHQTWYFLTSTLHTLLLIHVMQDVAKQFAASGTAESSSEVDAMMESHVGVEVGANRTLCTERKQHSEQHRRIYRKRSLSENNPSNITLAVSAASLVAILCILRVLRRWNQTGNKWLNIADVGDWLVKPENKSELSGLVMGSLLFLLLTRLSHLVTLWSRLKCIGAAITVYCSKAGTGGVWMPSVLTAQLSSQGVTEARLAYVFILALLASSLHQLTKDKTADHTHAHPREELPPAPTRTVLFLEGVQTLWLCVMCLLLRAHNVAMVAMMSVVERLLCSFVICNTHLRPSFLLLYCLAMGQAFFFFQGNSNSLSTVDVSAGYTGLRDYQPALIGLQMCLSTYAGVIFWLISCLKYIHKIMPGNLASQSLYQRLAEAYFDIAMAILLTCALPLAVYTTLVTLLRYHLFVWTVFSPKLLYEGMLTVVLSTFSIVCLYFGHTCRRKLKKLNRE